MIATKRTKGIEIISNNVGVIYLCYLLFDLFNGKQIVIGVMNNGNKPIDTI